ncbi:ParA family protein (plasmid) [Rhodovastum atsumiense]|uniref:ParA family protein n=1 Tax=Rhodovastum atsumiense TaxID=504468 RepID=A0A5M6IU00_9PROT|nr:ParA family protein [Rhodovastum atsumiense]KAA5611793.1 ParA family protein [Rhodovastum atsumiense]CAH2606100.1 ParA family protein [Rhodovastum atsumiense]
MKVVSVVQQKGGVSKTSIATALAVAASMEGKQAAVFDLDPQGSAAFWKDTRKADEPAVVSVQPVRLKHMLAAAKEAGTELVVIDAPPIAKDVAYQAAEVSDYILVPTKPSVLDVMAMTETLKLIKRATEPPVPHAVVLTLCPLQGREVVDTEEAVRKLGAEVAPVRLHNRIAYSRAQQSGLTAMEYEPEGKAAAELRQLYEFVCMHVWPHTVTRKPEKAAAA